MGSADGTLRGGYVFFEQAPNGLDVVLIGTGSEVEIAYNAAKQLAEEGIGVRVVSLASWEVFAKQGDEYIAQVLPPDVPRVAIEAAASFGWSRWVGNDPAKGTVLALDHFGASAPYQRLYEEFGLTPEHMVQAAKRLLGR